MTSLTLPRLLLIAGTGQNSGKTTFACRVITRHCNFHPIVGIKISSHFHKNAESGNILLNRNNLYIGEETDTSTPKDSARMLAAGARKSYFVMAKDEQLVEALEIIKTLISNDDFIVCESGGLRNYVTPDVFLMFHHALNQNPKANSQQLVPLCNRFITFDGEKLDFDIQSLTIANNHWHLNPQA